MEIIPPLIAHLQASEAIEPTQGPLHDPAMPPQPLARFDPASRDSRDNTAFAQLLPIRPRVIRLVGVQFHGTPSRTTAWPPDRRDRIDHRLQLRRFVRVGSRVADRQRRATPVHDEVALRPGLAPIGRVAARFLAPLGAGTLAASSEARSQSIWLALPKRSRSTRWRVAQTPAACQSRNRRQQVMPLPQPISWGKNSHWMPVLSTNTMPVSAARSVTRGRPPFGFGGSGGKSGAITAQRSSGTSGCAMPRLYQLVRFC